MDTPNSVVFPSSPDAAVVATTTAHGSTEVPGKATRRRFTLSYKRKIVALAAGLQVGETGALLRREGLYSSHLTHWRRQVAALDMETTEPRRGRKGHTLTRRTPKQLLNVGVTRLGRRRGSG